MIPSGTFIRIVSGFYFEAKAVKTRRYTPITSIAYQDRQARSSHQRSSSWSSISGPPRCAVLRCRLRCSRAPTM